MRQPTYAQLVVLLDYLLNTKGGVNAHYCQSIGLPAIYNASQGDLQAAQEVHAALTPDASREAVEASVERDNKNLGNPARLWVSGCLQTARNRMEQ